MPQDNPPWTEQGLGRMYAQRMTQASDSSDPALWAAVESALAYANRVREAGLEPPYRLHDFLDVLRTGNGLYLFAMVSWGPANPDLWSRLWPHRNPWDDRRIFAALVKNRPPSFKPLAASR